MSQKFTLNVNGGIHRVTAEPDTPLIYILRNDLGLKGTRLGCGLEQCGACKILIDGQAAPSCRIPVASAQDLEITTVEGIGSDDNLHPLQQAFIDEQAVQCGFCTSGMIIAAKALLDKNPNPTEEEIHAAMSDNLCRCGVYDRVSKAIHLVSGQPEAPSSRAADLKRDVTAKPKSPFSDVLGSLPNSIQETPDLDLWVRVNRHGTITLFSGKAELGQDIRTSVAVIGAEELDVSLERIRVVMADTAQSPNEGYTAGSMSLETTGTAIRQASAEARHIMLSAAGEKMGAPVDRLIVNDGTISDTESGRSVTYWDLFGGKRFDRKITGEGRPKRPETYNKVGRYSKRDDITAKVTGGAVFVHDMDLPGMVHGRVLRPPIYGARLISADLESVKEMPGIVQVVRDGSFLGVIADREEQAAQAISLLENTARWESGKILSTSETIFDHMMTQPDKPFLVVDGIPTEGPIPDIAVPADASKTLNATFYRPYHMHASMGPSAAVAQFLNGKLTVWTHAQGVYPLRADMARVLNMPEDDIRAIHLDGPGCFGHNGADDAALDAALLARALPERPISVKWTRTDENKWEPFGPAAVIKIQASLSSDGDVMDWNHDVWSYSNSSRPRGEAGTAGLLAAWYLEAPFSRPTPRPAMVYHGGIHRNADPLYNFPSRRIVKHHIPESPLRVSALRSLGSYDNIFAIESFMNELADAAGDDPVEFRLRYLSDERAREVIEAAVEKAGPSPDGLGRGMAFARYKNRQSYLAVVVDLSVCKDSGNISLERAVAAADAGQIVNPDAIRNQLEGVIIQSSSWTLKEQVIFDQNGIISVDWDRYPIFRLPDAPGIETVLIDRPGQPYLGIGEGAQGPISAAIANAVHDAAGIRLRRIPFTPERVKDALRKQSSK
jgi:CO/xanthine dehydrogenase Mo-binding subunit